MNMTISRLKTRINMINNQIGRCDRILMQTPSGVIANHEAKQQKQALLNDRQQLINQTAAMEALDRLPRGVLQN